MLFTTSAESERIVSQSLSITFSKLENISFLNPRFRSSFHICSIGFISGVYGGMKNRTMLSGTSRCFVLCHAAPSQQRRMTSLGYFLDSSFRNSPVHSVKEGIPCLRFHGPESVAVLANMMAGHRGAHTFPAPAVFRLVNSSEARLILEHQSYPPFFVDNFQLRDFFVNFFEDSMSSALAFLGCRLRGITFRQLCRRSTK